MIDELQNTDTYQAAVKGSFLGEVSLEDGWGWEPILKEINKRFYLRCSLSVKMVKTLF